jgi:transposase
MRPEVSAEESKRRRRRAMSPLEEEDMVHFLGLPARHVGPKMTVVWDGARAHDRSTAVREFLWRNAGVRTERFPGSAPDLDPDEGVWDHAKYAQMANFVPREAAQLRRKLRQELRRLGDRPDLLASFIRHPPPPWQCEVLHRLCGDQ